MRNVLLLFYLANCFLFFAVSKFTHDRYLDKSCGLSVVLDLLQTLNKNFITIDSQITMNNGLQYSSKRLVHILHFAELFVQ